MLNLNKVQTLISGAIFCDQEYAKRTSLRRTTLFIIACACLLFYTIYPIQNSLITFDSDSYIKFDATRTVGYPLFLAFIKKLTGGYESIPMIQLTLFVMSLTHFTASFMRSIKSFFLPLTFLLITLSLQGLMQFHFEILTESLFLSALMFLGTQWFSFIDAPSCTRAAWLGAIIGILILIRPSGYVILITVLLLICMKWSWIKQYSLSFIIPVTFALSLGSIMNYHLHGFFKTQSFLGHNLYGKVAFTLTDDMVDADPIKQKMITHMTKAMAPFQQSLTLIKSNKHYYKLAAPIYDVLRYHFLTQFQTMIPEMNTLPNRDDFYKDIAITIIKQNPTSYIKDVLRNYSALWLLWGLDTHTEYIELQSHIKTLKTLKAFKTVNLDYSHIKQYEKVAVFIPLVRAYLMLCFFISLYFIINAAVATLKRKNITTEALIGLFFALSIQATFWLTALLQAGYLRYSMIMWPYIFIMSLVFIKMVYTYILTKKDLFLL